MAKHRVVFQILADIPGEVDLDTMKKVDNYLQGIIKVKGQGEIIDSLWFDAHEMDKCPGLKTVDQQFYVPLDMILVPKRQFTSIVKFVGYHVASGHLRGKKEYGSTDGVDRSKDYQDLRRLVDHP